VEYVVLDLEAVKKTVSVNEADLKSYFEQNASSLERQRRASRQPHPDQRSQGHAGR